MSWNQQIRTTWLGSSNIEGRSWYCPPVQILGGRVPPPCPIAIDALGVWFPAYLLLCTHRSSQWPCTQRQQINGHFVCFASTLHAFPSVHSVTIAASQVQCSQAYFSGLRLLRQSYSFPSLHSLVHSLPSPAHSHPVSPFPIPLTQLWGLRERCKLPQRGPGRRRLKTHFCAFSLSKKHLVAVHLACIGLFDCKSSIRTAGTIRQNCTGTNRRTTGNSFCASSYTDKYSMQSLQCSTIR